MLIVNLELTIRFASVNSKVDEKHSLLVSSVRQWCLMLFDESCGVLLGRRWQSSEGGPGDDEPREVDPGNGCTQYQKLHLFTTSSNNSRSMKKEWPCDGIVRSHSVGDIRCNTLWMYWTWQQTNHDRRKSKSVRLEYNTGLQWRGAR